MGLDAGLCILEGGLSEWITKRCEWAEFGIKAFRIPTRRLPYQLELEEVKTLPDSRSWKVTAKKSTRYMVGHLYISQNT